jgi:Queuosine biosynthesis protein QueC
MAERLVLCGGSNAPGSRAENMLRLDLTGPGRNIELRLHDIRKRMLTHLPDLVIDLLELAAYVYSADWATSRGGEASRGMGAEWRRRFRFVVPVRRPELWSSPPVLDALSETLGFLTDDEYQFEFEEHRGSPPGVQDYLELEDEGTARFVPDEVVLFSGGLDSLAGVVDLALGQNKRAALVSHHSSTKVFARQKQLVTSLKALAPGRLLHFPVLLRKRESLTKEYTLRSRSFVFASLATAIGRMLGKRRVLMCENGIVSLNLPIARQLVGARSSRTTHPKALACFGLLFEMLFGEPTSVDNPFLWKTKAEVVKVIGDRGCSHLIASTISCSHVYQMSKEQPHCGECSQCIDRRFAILGAGLETQDPERQYRLKLLVDDWNAGEPRTLAESYIRSAVDARNASDEAFYAKFAGEISRAVQSLPGDRDRNARQLVDVQKRHAASVFSILGREVARRVNGLLDGSLPPHCLLRIAVTSHDQLRRAAEEVPILVDETSARSDEPQLLRDGLSAPEIQIAVNVAAHVVRVRGGLEFGGGDYELLRLLLDAFEEDQRNRKAPDNYRYTITSTLAKRLQVLEPTVRQRVLRIRKRLFNWFAEDYPLSQDALIENLSWRGYRINPAVRLLDLAEMDAADRPSRFSSRTSQLG